MNPSYVDLMENKYGPIFRQITVVAAAHSGLAYNPWKSDKLLDYKVSQSNLADMIKNLGPHDIGGLLFYTANQSIRENVSPNGRVWNAGRTSRIAQCYFVSLKKAVKESGKKISESEKALICSAVNSRLRSFLSFIEGHKELGIIPRQHAKKSVLAFLKNLDFNISLTSDRGLKALMKKIRADIESTMPIQWKPEKQPK